MGSAFAGAALVGGKTGTLAGCLGSVTMASWPPDFCSSAWIVASSFAPVVCTTASGTLSSLFLIALAMAAVCVGERGTWAALAALSTPAGVAACSCDASVVGAGGCALLQKSNPASRKMTAKARPRRTLAWLSIQARRCNHSTPRSFPRMAANRTIARAPALPYFCT